MYPAPVPAISTATAAWGRPPALSSPERSGRRRRGSYKECGTQEADESVPDGLEELCFEKVVIVPRAPRLVHCRRLAGGGWGGTLVPDHTGSNILVFLHLPFARAHTHAHTHREPPRVKERSHAGVWEPPARIRRLNFRPWGGRCTRRRHRRHQARMSVRSLLSHALSLGRPSHTSQPDLGSGCAPALRGRPNAHTRLRGGLVATAGALGNSWPRAIPRRSGVVKRASACAFARLLYSRCARRHRPCIWIYWHLLPPLSRAARRRIGRARWASRATRTLGPDVWPERFTGANGGLSRASLSRS